MASDPFTLLRTPLGSEALAFTHLTGRDRISRPFAFTLGMVGEDPALDPLDFLGREISVQADPPTARWLSGRVAEFSLTSVEGRLAYYEAVLRPAFWFLSLRTNNRIFQNMTAVEIVEAVLGEHPAVAFDKRLTGRYPVREYCVQYGESDLAFVRRMLEDEGIFFFFEYAEAEHKLVLADATARLPQASGHATIAFHREGEAHRRDKPFLARWTPRSRATPGGYVHRDNDFRNPPATLEGKSEAPFRHDLADGEDYVYPYSHPTLDLARAEALATVRREELQAPHRRVRASGRVPGLFAGARFALENFPRADQNAEYFVLGADYRLVDPAFRSGAVAPAERLVTTLDLAPTALAFRPARLTSRPVMRGPQTATVVGPGGEEIFTDEFGRVKIQFHWDRLGARDHNSSCFVRVSQAWAGAGWGFIQIPRIGQEVIVDFVDGDPDRPIITGRVYNANEMPPYALPGSATQSGIKTNSTPGGGGWNELRFEDKAGAEEVYFQAQKDHNLLVKNDRAKLVQHDQSDRIDNDAKHSVGVDLDEDVGNNKTTTVGVDRTVSIGSNDTETVGKNRSLSVGVDETITIGANSSESIGLSHSQTVGTTQTVTVGAARTDTVGAAEIRTVGAAQINSIGSVRQVSVGLAQSHDIGATDSWSIASDQSVSIGGGQSSRIAKARSTTIGADDSAEIGGARLVKVAKGSGLEVGEDCAIKVGKNLVIEAGDSVSIKTGSAEIVMKKDGTISITGKDITVKGSGKITVQASGDVVIKGSKINQN